MLDRIVDGFDEPFADASAIPTFHVAGMARRHVTVALSGDGGDEAFGGYSFRYVPHAVESVARSLLPGAPGRAAAAWLGARWPRRLPRVLRWGTQLENIARDPAAAYYADLCAVKPHVRRGSCSACRPLRDPRTSGVYEAVTEPYRRCPSTSAVQRAQYADLKIYLANDVLVKVDRMSMQHSLEVRCPLLDHRLDRTGIPDSDRDARCRTCSPSTCCGSWPASGCRRSWRGCRSAASPRRSPSGLPDRARRCFEHDVCRPRRRRRVAGRHRLRPAAVRRASDGRANHGQALWTVWMLARWHDRTASRQAAAITLPDAIAV